MRWEVGPADSGERHEEFKKHRETGGREGHWDVRKGVVQRTNKERNGS